MVASTTMVTRTAHVEAPTLEAPMVLAGDSCLNGCDMRLLGDSLLPDRHPRCTLRQNVHGFIDNALSLGSSYTLLSRCDCSRVSAYEKTYCLIFSCTICGLLLRWGHFSLLQCGLERCIIIQHGFHTGFLLIRAMCWMCIGVPCVSESFATFTATSNAMAGL